MCGINLTAEQALQELWKGRSWVLIANDSDPRGHVRLNRTPANTFLLMAGMTMVEITDCDLAFDVAQDILRGILTLEQVRANYPPAA
jgi:hypothetical protein